MKCFIWQNSTLIHLLNSLRSLNKWILVEFCHKKHFISSKKSSLFSWLTYNKELLNLVFERLLQQKSGPWFLFKRYNRWNFLISLLNYRIIALKLERVDPGSAHLLSINFSFNPGSTLFCEYSFGKPLCQHQRSENQRFAFSVYTKMKVKQNYILLIINSINTGAI